MKSQFGSPTGTGNPPGAHSKSYLKPNSGGNFMKGSSSVGMDIGRGKVTKTSPSPVKTSTIEENSAKNKPF